MQLVDVLGPHARGGAPRGSVRRVSVGVGIERVKQLIDSGAQLVEVLPEQEFSEEHLPGAISLPLKKLNARSARALDRGRPVIVYCWDGL